MLAAYSSRLAKAVGYIVEANSGRVIAAAPADARPSHPSLRVSVTGGSALVVFAAVNPQSVVTPLPDDLEGVRGL